MVKSNDILQLCKDKDGNKIIIRRCNSSLYSIKAYIDCLKEEVRIGKSLHHPNLPEYEDIFQNESEIYVKYKYVPILPLNKALLESSFHINNKKDADSIIMQLLDVVSFMHKNGVYHLNITPSTVYITRNKHHIYLFCPNWPYLHSEISYAVFSYNYSAPELFNNGSCKYELCDIYSIGKLMEYLYSYSNLSPWIQYIIRKATNRDFSKRYQNIEELKKDFSKRNAIGYGITGLKLAVALGFLTICYTALKDDADEKENYIFREQTRHSHEIISKQKENTSIDTISTKIIPADSLSVIDEKTRIKAEQIFKKEFRKEAEKIINKIYSADLMNSTPDVFQKASIDGSTQLDKIQKDMALKYNMDITYSTRLSSEVIDELTKERMQKMRNKNSQN